MTFAGQWFFAGGRQLLLTWEDLRLGHGRSIGSVVGKQTGRTITVNELSVAALFRAGLTDYVGCFATLDLGRQLEDAAWQPTVSERLPNFICVLFAAG